MATPNATNSTKLQSFIDRHSLHLIPSPPSHHQLWNNSHTWIDLFITKNPYPVTYYIQSPAPFIAGRDFIELSLLCKNPPRQTKPILSRNLKKLDPHILNYDLHSHLLALPPPNPLSFRSFITCSTTSGVLMVPCPADVSADERKLTNAIISAFDSCTPLRPMTLSSHRKPWISPQIRSLMRTRDRAYRTARTSGSTTDVQIFRAARATASNALDTAKNHYILTRLEEAASPEAK